MDSQSQKVKLNPIDEPCAQTSESAGRTPPFTIPADGAGVPAFEALGGKDIMGATAPMPSRCTWEERATDPGYSIEGADNPIRHNPGMEETMHEYKAGSLHSGSKKGPVVKNRKQAIAIAMSEKRRGQ